MLAFRQSRACKQEVGHCDLILLKIFFYFDNSKTQGATNALYKILA